MTNTRPTKKAPAAAGAEKVCGNVLTAVGPGNRKSVARAYGHAAAWLKAGKMPPPELTAWLTERLDDLTAVLRDDHDKKLVGVNAALWASQPGKRGRKPASKTDEAYRSFLAWDCYYERRLTGDKWDAIFDRVAYRCSQVGVFTTPTQVEAVWKARRSVAPEIPEIDS